jgi:hypothetical protein
MIIDHFPPYSAQNTDDLSEIRKAVQTTEEAQYFVPKDRRIINRYGIAEEAIRKFSFDSLSLKSSLLNRMVLSYYKDKADPKNASSKFPEHYLVSIVEKLIQENWIQGNFKTGTYPPYLRPVIVFCICEEHLAMAERQELGLKHQIEYRDHFPFFEKQMKKVKQLTGLLFSLLSLEKQAKIKVQADRFALSSKLYEQNPFLWRFSENYQEQSSGIEQRFIVEGDSLLDTKELNLNNTYIETIPPEIFRCLGGLKKLSFAENQSDSLAILSLISQLTNLEELNLSCNAFTSLPPMFFENLHLLKNLDLRNNKFPKKTADDIAHICLSKNIALQI